MKNLIYLNSTFLYANIVGYALHLYVSRNLGPVGYGEYMVLYSFMLTVGNIGLGFSNVGVKIFSDNWDERKKVLQYLRILTFAVGGALFAGGTLLSVPLKTFLNVSSPSYIIVVAFCWMLMFVLSMERGFVQAEEKFGYLSFAICSELTMRLLLVVLFINLGFSVGGIISSSIYAFLLSEIILLARNRGVREKVKKVSKLKLIHLAAFTIPASMFIYADDIFIRRIFDEHTAGLYASVSVLGKAFIFLMLTSFSVFFPKIVKYRGTSEFSSHIRKLFLLYLFLGVSAVSFCAVFGSKIFMILFGEKFSGGAWLLVPYFIAVVPLVIHITFINIFISFEKGLKYVFASIALYYSGFIFLRIGIVYYVGYIGSVNLMYCAIDALMLKSLLNREKV